MLNMLFLYFPEDKTEYIPSIIIMLAFMALAGLAFYLIIKKSKKDEAKFNEKYAEQLEEAENKHQHS